MKILATIVVCWVLCAPTVAFADECDFEKPIGSCTAGIRILSASGSKPSYRAEISVRSSAPRCSKVEWYLDSTPHSTILKSKDSDTDSIFGTSPITGKSISVQRCTIYAEKNGQGSAKTLTRYGSCAGNTEARAILDSYDSAPSATLGSSLANMRKNLPALKSILARTQGYRSSDADFYAKNKAMIEREIAALQARVNWNSNAIRVLEGCAR